ncbi:DUF1365 domain-containing protein [Thalassotalea euphylliae]|uniref:DUF1365 domain-containing protein n=1 Tax=Thalassotalea euphylliae TaxID=1655234 RepID=A0A3E0TQU5_9GAMM|nr:DUF1365 domain-containing protein [Thalassotalea euphylliae]REL26884.1 DUF1365 domain-containing protein [Thalassotalea euphylliae]
MASSSPLESDSTQVSNSVDDFDSGKRVAGAHKECINNNLYEQQSSAVFVGSVRHRRFSPKAHSFSYPLYMLGLDVDEISAGEANSSLLGNQWYKPLRFNEQDYLRGEPGTLKQRIVNKISSLGGSGLINSITMLVQVRCFGLYFSPANFYFAYCKSGECQYMLVEVSNTPWNKRHYYLVDMKQIAPSEKDFHVSPFMDLNMAYHWRVIAPSRNQQSNTIENSSCTRSAHDKANEVTNSSAAKTLIHIENRTPQNEKLFDATLALKRLPLTNGNLGKVWRKFPAMTLNVVTGIYIQALKLLLKRIPFVPYQHKENKQEL